MSGNTFGKLFTLTTAGESHGPAYMVIVDGCPPGLLLSESDIQVELDRRRPGYNQMVSQRCEPDRVQILSGVFKGKTTGTPIALLIENQNARSRDYTDLQNRLRPGHADYVYQQKYGVRDHRGGGRASARETVCWVAAGAIAKKYLFKQCGVTIQADVVQVGTHAWSQLSLVEQETIIADCRRDNESFGSTVCVVVDKVPIGLGEPVFDKLDADLAKALMTINAVKAVEIGDGMKASQQKGSEARDAITPEGFVSNHAGGIVGGISTGQPIVATVSFKPTSSIPQAIATVDNNNEACEVSVTGRHDPCVGLRAPAIVEAMAALVLMDHFLRFRGQCGSRYTDSRRHPELVSGSHFDTAVPYQGDSDIH